MHIYWQLWIYSNKMVYSQITLFYIDACGWMLACPCMDTWLRAEFVQNPVRYYRSGKAKTIILHVKWMLKTLGIGSLWVNILTKCYLDKHYMYKVYFFSVKLPNKLVIGFTKFRTCNTRLPIEKARCDNISRYQRYCELCDQQIIGDEYHFLP
jgi:hypothetical protein